MPQFLGLTDTIHLISRAAIAAASPFDELLQEQDKVRAGKSVTSLIRGSLRTSNPRAAQPLQQPLPGRSLAVRTDAAGYLQELIHHAELTEHLKLTTHALRGPDFTRERKAAEVRLAYVTGHIERSLFEDGHDAGLSDPLIVDLTEIFGWDVDFALDVRAGDRFAVIHEEKYWRGQKIADGEILAAEYVNQGQLYRAIGFRGADGRLTYYTPTGRSLKRTFLRTPVKFSRVTSFFSNARYHPVLKMWRAHNGVDYSSPQGTPVQATASGRVVSMGWKGSYGKTIVLDHGGAYTTLYAHLSGYRSDLREGQQIKQGATIGYVGRTGLTTGPHLHYELQFKGRHQNPLTFEFPDGAYIAAETRQEYWRAARIWTARLDFISGRTLAAR